MEYRIRLPEVYRYLGINATEISAETEALVRECADVLYSSAKPRYTYKIFPLFNDTLPIIDESELKLEGEVAGTMLKNSTKCALLAVTLGIETDNLIRRAQVTDMTRAVIYDACATELVECVCDGVQAEIYRIAENDGLAITDRFSPGYGDLSISLQTDICTVLDTARKIGVSPTKDFLLLPTKSVTAFIGIGKAEAISDTGFKKRLCKDCVMQSSCVYRKNGSDYCTRG